MIEKVKSLFKKFGWYGVAVALTVIAIPVVLLINLFSAGKYDANKITKKLDVIIDKSKDKLAEIKAKEVVLEIEKKISLEAAVEEKAQLIRKLELTKNIPNKRKRVEDLIALNQSIEIKL